MMAGTHRHRHWIPGSSPFGTHKSLLSGEHVYHANNNRGKLHIVAHLEIFSMGGECTFPEGIAVAVLPYQNNYLH
jgi:hypothetical protein